MPSRLLRPLLALAIVSIVWLVAVPARAAAASSFSVDPVRSVVTRSMTSVAPAGAPAPQASPPTTMAPLCDPRGASMVAPPAQMQDTEVSLDTALTAEDCMASSSSGRARSAAPGGTAPSILDASASPDAAVTPAAPKLPSTGPELIPAPAASLPCPRPGFRSTVDRPPRA